MATMQTRLSDLATRVATECKAIRTLMNGNAANLSALTTTNKTSIVAALNELKSALGASINDAAASATTTYSSNKIVALINTAVSGLVASAPGALDTLDELASALGDDANFAATVSTALGNRVRTDTALQGLDVTQQSNARANIGALGTSEIGNPDTDFVTVFTNGLL